MHHYGIDSDDGGERRQTAVEPGLTLAQSLFIQGAFRGRALCSGAGRCGLCQVRFLEGAPEPTAQEQQRISHDRLEQGWRLSCVRHPVPGSVVRTGLAPRRSAADWPLPPACAEGLLGVDLGTTSIHWRFIRGTETLGGQFPNPQLGGGSEVMARLSLGVHPGGAERLRQVVAEAVLGVVSGLPCLPTRICLAGNTCMTALALGQDTSGLRAAPYRVDWPGHAVAELDARLPGVYIPPLLAPFVGGDVSAGLAALAFSDTPPRPPYLLADLGTNGEFALELPGGEVLLASVPMGPALEGVGMARGMIAASGAATAFALTPAGLAPSVLGGGTAKGISGTGYLSLLARLVGVGAVSPQGLFNKDAPSPLAARCLAGLGVREGEACLDVAGLELFASDVEALLKVKAAFNVAVRLLLEKAGLPYASLNAVLLAGALGEHVAPADLETLGFLPPGGAAKVRAVGNTSLDGACLAAGRKDVRAWLGGLAARSSLVDVAAHPGFQDAYIGSMRFSHAG